MTPLVGVVVVAFGDEPILAECVESVRASTGVDVDLAIVDNGFTCAERDRLEADGCITWVRPGWNTGFTGGCLIGSRAVAGDVLVFLNSDAVLAPEALHRLVDRLADPGVGLVSGCVVLYDDPGRLNSAGNPVHFSMLSWAGGWGELIQNYPAPASPASISGCLFAIRQADWEAFGGFHQALFAYGEDVELSMRTRLAGRSVAYEPGAVVRHHYEFHANPGKLYLLERNRLINLLTIYEAGTLLALAPALVAVETGITLTALRQGWLRQKVAGWRWIVAHRREIAERRRLIQSERVRSDAELSPALSLEITPSPLTGASVPKPVNRLLAGYARRALGQGRRSARIG